MRVGLRIGLLVVIAIVLAGCGTTIETTPAPQSAAIKDCREPGRLFNAFTVHATRVAWSGSGRAATLLIAVKIENATEDPAALSNSEGGILYTLDYTLKDDIGKAHAPSVTSGVLAAGYVHALIKPGEPKEGTVSFTAPRGRYTFAIERKLSGQAPPPRVENTPFVCTVTVMEPSRARKPAPTTRP